MVYHNKIQFSKMGRKIKDKSGTRHNSSKFEFPSEIDNTFLAKVTKCIGESQFQCCDIENPAIIYIAKIRAGMRRKGEALVLKEGSYVLLFDRRNPEVKYTYSEKDVNILKERNYIINSKTEGANEFLEELDEILETIEAVDTTTSYTTTSNATVTAGTDVSEWIDFDDI